MCEKNENKSNKSEAPLEFPQKENKTIVEPVRDIEKIRVES